jgi:dihydrofolate reductase
MPRTWAWCSTPLRWGWRPIAPREPAKDLVGPAAKQERIGARDQIAEFKRRPGREILVFGSRTLWNDLLAAGLVDELHLMVGAVVLGDGTPAFRVPAAAPLRLLGAPTFDGSDNLLVRYAADRTQ